MLALSPNAEAQLNGVYTYDIAQIFGKDFYFYEDDDNYESIGGVCSLWFSDSPSIVLSGGTDAVHDPRTGSFSITGESDFGTGANSVEPSDLNPTLPNSDYFALDSAVTTIRGKTSTNKRTGRPVIDISTGSIRLVGHYNIGISSENLVRIRTGNIAFSAKGMDADTSLIDGVAVKVTGSATLNNRQVKRFNSQPLFNSGMYGDYPFSDSWTTDGITYTYYSSLYLDLDIVTNGSAISGTAELYTNGTTTKHTGEVYSSWWYPLSSDESKWWKYSVKGTRRNGVATLNLTGLGVIRGLKATIHINENTDEIVPNGRNSITLYGQTITY